MYIYETGTWTQAVTMLTRFEVEGSSGRGREALKDSLYLK